jgi:hypothetical protein
MKIFSPTISGSSQTSGSLTISGSLNVSQGITGSLLGTASWAINVINGGGGSTDTGSLLKTASVNLNTITFTKGDGSTFPITVNTGSGGGGSVGTLAQVTALGASTTVPITASIISASSFTGSLFGTASWATNALTASFLPIGTYNITASWAQSASNAINARTASFVNNLNQNLSITGAVILSGSSLPELQVIGETQFTGSVNSLNGFTGSLLGTSSWATNALTASFLPIGTYNITSSWAQSASNAINARTASFLPVGTYSITSSWATNALTSSFVNNLNQNLSITGAVVISGSALPELRVIGDTQFTGSINSFNGYTGSLFGTASFATTASHALNGGVTSIAAGSGISINQSTGNVTITNTGGGGAAFPYTGSAIISGSLIVTGNLDTTQGGIDAIRIKETSLTNAGQYDRGVTLADTWSSSGPTLIAGRVVYLSGSGQWAEAVASAIGSSTGVLGVVTTTANQNDIVLHGLVRVSQSLAGFTNGSPVYLATSSNGTITQTPPSTVGHVARYVGYVIDSGSRQVYFNPDFTWIQL